MKLVDIQRYEKVLDALISYADEKGIKVKFDEFKDGGGNFSVNNNEITLGDNHISCQVAILAHEIGHALEYENGDKEKLVNRKRLRNVQYNIIDEMGAWVRAYHVLEQIDAIWCYNAEFINQMLYLLNSYFQRAANLNDKEWQEQVESFHPDVKPFIKMAFRNRGVRA